MFKWQNNKESAARHKVDEPKCKMSLNTQAGYQLFLVSYCEQPT